MKLKPNTDYKNTSTYIKINNSEHLYEVIKTVSETVYIKVLVKNKWEKKIRTKCKFNEISTHI